MADKVEPKRTTRRVAKKTTSRKAPTSSTGGRRSGGERTLLPFVAIGVFILILGVSVVVGFTDEGQIDISKTINDKKQYGTDEEKESLKNIPVQKQQNRKPDGGLVPTTDPNPNPVPVPKVETASSTATSTDETASSTEEVTSEDEEATEPEVESEEATEETAPTE